MHLYVVGNTCLYQVVHLLLLQPTAPVCAASLSYNAETNRTLYNAETFCLYFRTPAISAQWHHRQLVSTRNQSFSYNPVSSISDSNCAAAKAAPQWPPNVQQQLGLLQLSSCNLPPVVRCSSGRTRSLPIPWRDVMKHGQRSGAMRASREPDDKESTPPTYLPHSSWTLDSPSTTVCQTQNQNNIELQDFLRPNISRLNPSLFWDQIPRLF